MRKRGTWVLLAVWVVLAVGAWGFMWRRNAQQQEAERAARDAEQAQRQAEMKREEDADRAEARRIRDDVERRFGSSTAGPTSRP
jgi:uncharacterized protein HemX